MVVGGRALEEDEAGEEPTAHLGNFAFYNSKASKYPSRVWAHLLSLGLARAAVSTLQVERLRLAEDQELCEATVRGMPGWASPGGCRGACDTPMRRKARGTAVSFPCNQSPGLWSLLGSGTGVQGSMAQTALCGVGGLAAASSPCPPLSAPAGGIETPRGERGGE